MFFVLVKVCLSCAGAKLLSSYTVFLLCGNNFIAKSIARWKVVSTDLGDGFCSQLCGWPIIMLKFDVCFHQPPPNAPKSKGRSLFVLPLGASPLLGIQNDQSAPANPAKNVFQRSENGSNFCGTKNLKTGGLQSWLLCCTYI